MLPVATPPNAIVFSAAGMQSTDMVRYHKHTTGYSQTINVKSVLFDHKQAAWQNQTMNIYGGKTDANFRMRC
jgi:hypothetical protein